MVHVCIENFKDVDKLGKASNSVLLYITFCAPISNKRCPILFIWQIKIFSFSVAIFFFFSKNSFTKCQDSFSVLFF